MDRTAIATYGLTRRFGNLLAVDNLALTVPRQSIYGFLGPNGAGKTTTIRLLLGLLRPNVGRVLLLGQPLQGQRTALLGRVGTLVETPSLYPHLTGRENLQVVQRLLSLRPQQIDQALGIVELRADADRKVGQYSLGMRQRLGLALALLAEPELLILDEPTNGLDPAGIHEMRALICRLPQTEGVTVFLSSHLLSEVEQMATHLGIIQQGRLLFEGTLDELHSRMGDEVTLAADQPQLALELLRRAGWSAQPSNNHHLVVPVNGQADVALINAQLVGAGVNVYHLSLARPSLEELFLSLTETHTA